MTYTITITDPDAPSRDDPKWSEFCHWIATGLPASSRDSITEDNTTCAPLALSLVNLDDEVMPYYPPGPPEKTGKHRYVFLVFAPENGTTDALHLSKPRGRRHWGYEYEGERVRVRMWARDNGLIPVGEYLRSSPSRTIAVVVMARLLTNYSCEFYICSKQEAVIVMKRGSWLFLDVRDLLYLCKCLGKSNCNHSVRPTMIY